MLSNEGQTCFKNYVEVVFEYPKMWVRPQVPLEGPPPPPPLGPLPPHQTGPPRSGLPEHCKKSQGGWGEEGGRGRGGKGFGLREGSSNCNGGWGGGPSKHQLGPDPHLGAPKVCGRINHVVFDKMAYTKHLCDIYTSHWYQDTITQKMITEPNFIIFELFSVISAL